MNNHRFTGGFIGIGKENKTILRLPYLVLILLVLLVFANSFQNSFVWDDIPLILDNPGTYLAAEEMHRIFITPLWRIGGYAEGRQDYYRPLVSLLFVLNYKIWGMNPVGFHITNIILHILSALILYRICLLFLNNDIWLSVITAAIFAVHPAATNEPIGRAASGEVVYGFFVILSVYLFLKEKKYLSLFAFSLALFSKEAAVMLPFTFLILAIHRSGLKRGLLAMAPYAAVTGIYLILREAIVVAAVPYKLDQPIFTRMLTVFVAIFDYARLLLIPYPLSPLYPARWHLSIFEPKVFIAVITLISALLFALKLRRDKTMLFLLMFPFIMLAPVVLLVNRFRFGPDIVYIAERFLYVPAMVFPIFVSASAIKFAGNRARAYIVTAGVVIIGIFAVITASSNMIWKNEINLFQRMVRDTPDIVSAHNNLGIAYYSRDQLDEAIKEYFIALKLDPNYPDVHNNLGSAYAKTGQFDEAIKEYLIALKLDPNYPDAHNNLGIAYESQERLDEAINEFITALRIKPTYAEAHFNLGVVYYEQGRINEAINEYISALKLNPDDVKAHYNLGVAYYKQGRVNEAINEYISTLKLNPDDVKAHYNLGVVYYEQGRVNEAINEYISTLKLNPDHVVAHNNLAFSYYLAGNYDRAYQEFQKTVEMDPKFPNAYYGLGLVYKKQGKLKDARNHFEEYLKLAPKGAWARKVREELGELGNR